MFVVNLFLQRIKTADIKIRVNLYFWILGRKGLAFKKQDLHALNFEEEILHTLLNDTYLHVDTV